MRRVSLYRFLTYLCLVTAGTAAILALVGAGLAHLFEAAAAGVCAAVFFVPGLLFFRYWQRLASRDLALAHAATLAEDAGVTDGRALAAQLDVPEADATKILRIAVREGRLRGEVDASGRFVAASAPRCAACGSPVPRTLGSRPCPSCGKPAAGGV